MNSIALTVASANSMNSLMEVQHQSVKRALIPTSSPDRQEKIQLRERSLNTSPLPLITFTVEESKQSMEEIGAEAAPQQPLDHRPPRRASRFQSAPTTETFQPASEGVLPASSGFLHFPLSRIAVHLVKYLSRASAPRSGGLVSTAPTALPCASAAPVDLTAPSAAAPAISRQRISWDPSPPPLSPVAEGGHPCTGPPPPRPLLSVPMQ